VGAGRVLRGAALAVPGFRLSSCSSPAISVFRENPWLLFLFCFRRFRACVSARPAVASAAMSRRLRLLVALILFAAPLIYGWHDGTGRAEKAIREHPERIENPDVFRYQLGVRGATSGSILGFLVFLYTYFGLGFYYPRIPPPATKTSNDLR
jgi:hypothetical protein